jgi:hypothetical protein
LSGKWKRDERSGRWERPGAAESLKLKVNPEARRITGHFARTPVARDPETRPEHGLIGMKWTKHDPSSEDNGSQASIPDNGGTI